MITVKQKAQGQSLGSTAACLGKMWAGKKINSVLCIYVYETSREAAEDRSCRLVNDTKTHLVTLFLLHNYFGTNINLVVWHCVGIYSLNRKFACICP